MDQLLRPARLRWIIAVLGGMLLPGNGIAAEVKPLPPDSPQYGLKLSDWAMAWFQWGSSIPLSASPFPELDTKSQRAGVGQRTPVWFVPGVGAGNSGASTSRIPEGQAILINIAASSVRMEPGEVTDDELMGLLAEVVALELLPITRLEVSLDGVAVPNLQAYRVRTPVFTIAVPPDNLFGIDVGKDPRVAAAVEGYFVLFPPLPVGMHVLAVRREAGPDYKGLWKYNLLVQKPNEPLP